MSVLPIKIFVSSPGDVTQERFLTEKVLTRLQNVYRNLCKLEPIFWELEPLTADKSFQEGLVSPRETDIVICILWSRLGTRLPKNVTGGADLTGTEFEVMEAIEGRREKGIPDLLVYRKEAKALTDLNDTQRSEEALDQKKALDVFVDKWFKNTEGALIAAFHPFKHADQFEEHLQHHLRKLIESRLVAVGISPDDGIALTATWTESSPFRGLEHFDFEHEPIFFGRTKAIGEVIDRLKGQAEIGRAFLLVLGMSGSGKSSLTRAGVLPALSRPGVIEGVRLCRRVIFRPGDGLGDIFDAIAAALLRNEALPELADDGTTAAQLAQSLRENPGAAAMMVKGAISQAAGVLKPTEEGAKQPQARLLFLVDQLEELFTNDKIPPDDRSKFARLLKSLACNPLSQTWVIATLRSDFYAPLSQVPELADLKEGLGQYDLLSPSPAEIGLLVREPATAAGLRFEQKPEGERLDDVLRDEASQDPSLLPLLEFTLDELYNRRTDRGKLTFDAYAAIGGVKGALAQRAETTFTDLPGEVQQELPAIFRRLVTIGTLSDETPTAQRTPLARFAASPTRMQFVEAFIAARLFVSDLAEDGSAVVRITHESLLSRWERLQRWLAADREHLQVKARVERTAARWLQEGRRADLLLTAGKPLDEAEQLQASGFELEPEVEDLIGVSRRKADRNRRLRQAAIAALALLTLAACSFAVLAQIQRKRADEGAQLAKKAKNETEQANQKLQKTNGELDAAKKLAETKTHDAVTAQQATEQANQQLKKTNVALDAAKILAESKTRDTVNALKTVSRQLALSYIDRGVHELEHGDRWQGFAILGQAYRLAGDAADLRSSARLLLGAWDVALPRTLWNGCGVNAVAFSPDGTRCATASEEHAVRLWDVATGSSTGAVLHDDAVVAVAYSPDGRKIASASKDKTTRLSDAYSGELLIAPLKHDGSVKAVAYSPDGTKIATACEDKMARLWNAATGKLLIEPLKHEGVVNAVAFSPDGTKLATASGESAWLWEVVTGKLLFEPLKHSATVKAVAFSPDGRKIATASYDQTAQLWDAATGKPLGDPLRHRGWVNGLAFSPDGTQIVTGSDDNTAQLWEVTTGKPLGAPLQHNGRVEAVAFSPDGMKVATGTWRTVWEATTAVLWDAAAGKPFGEPLRHGNALRAVAYSPNGTTIATAGDDATARLWDVATGRPVGAQLRHSRRVRAVAFSPDGTKVVTGSDDGTARLWNATTGKPLGEPIDNDEAVLGVAFSPDGRKIATAGPQGDSGSAQVWDVATHKPFGVSFRHHEWVTAVAFSRDGTKIATASFDNTAQLWVAATGKPLGGPLRHDGHVNTVAFNPGGTKAVTGSADKTARVWDVVTGQPLGDPLRHGENVLGVAFSPDGTMIATASADNTAQLWDTGTGQPLGEPFRHDGPATGVAFSPDGTKLATASEDDTARLWGVPQAAPDDSRWLAAYVEVVSQLSEDADHALHRLTAEEDHLNWRDVLMDKSPALLDYQSTFLEQRLQSFHAYEADRQAVAGEWFVAAYHVQWLCEREPKNVQWWTWLAYANAEEGHWAESHRAYRVANALLPDSFNLHFCAGLTALAKNDGPAFHQDMTDLLALAEKSAKPGDWGLAASLAALSGAKDIERPKFLDLARKAIAADDKQWSYHLALGGSLYRAGDYAAAVSELNKANELKKANAQDPAKVDESYSVHAFLAVAYQRLGKTAESNEQRAVLKQIAEKASTAQWDWNRCEQRVLLDAEVFFVCGPVVKAGKKDNQPKK